jgi:hypothetical protein
VACRSHWRLVVEVVDLAFVLAQEAVPGVAAGSQAGRDPPVQEHRPVVPVVGVAEGKIDGECGEFVGKLEVRRGPLSGGNPAEGQDCLAVGTGTEAVGMEL